MSITTDEIRLTHEEVSVIFHVSVSTLAKWRMRRAYDHRYPRFHKSGPRRVYYLRHEVEEDLKKWDER
jgi:hypothetical protein